jgi:hypothetical protein
MVDIPGVNLADCRVSALNKLREAESLLAV